MISSSTSDRALALRILTGFAIGLLICTAYAGMSLSWLYVDHAPKASIHLTQQVLLGSCVLLAITRLGCWLLEGEYKFKIVPSYNKGYRLRWVSISRDQNKEHQLREGWRLQTPRRVIYLTRAATKEHVRAF